MNHVCPWVLEYSNGQHAGDFLSEPSSCDFAVSPQPLAQGIRSGIRRQGSCLVLVEENDLGLLGPLGNCSTCSESRLSWALAMRNGYYTWIDGSY